jgi:hypothetical protein
VCKVGGGWSKSKSVLVPPVPEDALPLTLVVTEHAWEIVVVRGSDTVG